MYTGCAPNDSSCQHQRDLNPMPRVSYQDMFDALLRVLLKLGFEAEGARRCAQLFTETDLDGVYSHGLNRFPRFVSMIQSSGLIDIQAKPELVASSGARSS